MNSTVAFLLFIIAGIMSFASVILIIEAYETDFVPWYGEKRNKLRLISRRSRILCLIGVICMVGAIMILLFLRF